MATEKKPYFVTIQRQFGSLGRPIAKKMSELLQIEYYDRDILERTSKEMNMDVSDIVKMEEKSYSRMKYPLGKGEKKFQDHIFNVQQCIISEIALRNQSCIIVGRCSDYVLRHMDNTLNIYIYAPYEARLNNCIHTLGMESDEAEKMIKSIDEARKNYHKYYTGYPADTLHDRQLLIDSSLLGAEQTANLLVEIVKKKFL